MEELYYIVGHVDVRYLSENPSSRSKHPVDKKDIKEPRSSFPPLPQDIDDVFDWDFYIKRIEKEICEHGFENHIEIDKKPKNIFILEKDIYYYPKYKITVKNLIINVQNSDPKREMLFYPPTSPSASALNKDGIYLAFENNHFIGKNHQESVNFYPKESAYFIFKNNMFISVNLFIETESVHKIELKGNIFRNSNVEISQNSRPHRTARNIIQSVFCLDDNIFYRRDTDSSKLSVTVGCHFKGKNTVDNLTLGLDPLHWGGYQNIDPEGKHSHTHRQMFIDFMGRTIKSNDKMQEVRLRRELMKCERALLRKEKRWSSFQDRIILEWSGWISDYGISWLHPILRLIFINALLASVVLYFFEPQSSWLLLFAEFFNPLSHLSGINGIEENNGLISSINIAQKALLALFLYEMIKIFRRFSK